MTVATADPVVDTEQVTDSGWCHISTSCCDRFLCNGEPQVNEPHPYTDGCEYTPVCTCGWPNCLVCAEKIAQITAVWSTGVLATCEYCGQPI